MTTQQNWSGHVTFRATQLHYPETIEQVQEIVRRARKIKVVGAAHSFNAIADSTEALISLEKLDRTPVIDRARSTVTVNAGITYGELCQWLARAGYSLHNMASLPHITVAGACATATHGSGDNNGNLATAVSAMELVTADGELVVLARETNREQFEGAVVGLGGLGVITKMTLDIAPSFFMQQEVYADLPVAQVEAHFDAIMSSAYSVSFFTDWQKGRVNHTWLKRRLTGNTALDVQPTFFEATLATQHLHPLATLDAANCTEQMGIPGLWHERLPHFRVDHTPASGDELQTEYFVPRQHAVAAMRAVTELQPAMERVLWISEVRTIAADTLWLSPSYQQAAVGIHFSWRKDWPTVEKLILMLEERLAPFQARPHWGKLFLMSPSLVQSLYPRMADFQNLLRTLDPQGKFRNDFIDTYLFGNE